MERHLNRGIKEVISEFPEVGQILEDFEIGCTPCLVGTCLLKDVVEIHALPPDQEAELMYRVEKAIYPERDVQPPETGAVKGAEKAAEITYSAPVRELVDEHKLIKRWLSLIPRVVDLMNRSGLDRQLINNGLDFIRSYADRFHHAKEEDLLFKYVDESQEIIQAMYSDHITGRGHVQSIVKGLEQDDMETVREHLFAYRELLTGHIKKEDEILFPWIDRQLTAKNIAQLSADFSGVNAGAGEGFEEKYQVFVTDLEKLVAM
ncbi:MAG: hemerythrin domain-containing protein [Dethiobacter sp.]|nr:hemerythrin domain-containing protein [Dethiobacter sp.]